MRTFDLPRNYRITIEKVSAASDMPDRTSIENRLGTNDEEKTEEAIAACERLIAREESRQKVIDSKAVSLLGATGIASSIVVGVAGFLFDRAKIPNLFVLVPLVVSFVLLLWFLMRTACSAIRCLKLRAFSYPDPDHILDLKDTELAAYKRELAIDLFYSYERNLRIDNEKGEYCVDAQCSFLCSVILLFLVGVIIAIGAVINTPG